MESDYRTGIHKILYGIGTACLFRTNITALHTIIRFHTTGPKGCNHCHAIQIRHSLDISGTNLLQMGKGTTHTKISNFYPLTARFYHCFLCHR